MPVACVHTCNTRELVKLPVHSTEHVLLTSLDLHVHSHTRYYTSIPLTTALLTHDTMFTGTAMKNRKKLPSTIRHKGFTVRAGETHAFRDGRLLALAWQAETKKTPLIMVSSCGSAQLVTIATRCENVSKLAVVNSYNHSMNGVDVADQLTVYYSFVGKTRKWWRKIFFYLLEVSVVNSYLL